MCAALVAEFVTVCVILCLMHWFWYASLSLSFNGLLLAFEAYLLICKRHNMTPCFTVVASWVLSHVGEG